MNFLKLFVILSIGLCLISNLAAQQYTYPNEVKGFELFKSGNWKTLIPYVSTKEDVERVFGRGCESESCDYDENWRVLVMYVGKVWGYSQSQGKSIQCVSDEMIGKYSSLIFYPRKRITRDKLKFGPQFSKWGGGSSHSIPSISDYFADSSGVMYQFSAENTEDKSFRKGDLVSIRYTESVSDYEKYRSRIDCK